MLLCLAIWFAPAVASLPIVVSDFRCRRVAVVWLAAVLVACFAATLYTDSWPTALTRTAANASLVALLMLCLAVWTRLRHGAGARLGSHFGAGDLCYMLALAPLLPPVDFIRLITAAALLSLIWYYALNRARRTTIPFAAMIGITLVAITLLRFVMLWMR